MSDTLPNLNAEEFKALEAFLDAKVEMATSQNQSGYSVTAARIKVKRAREALVKVLVPLYEERIKLGVD